MRAFLFTAMWFAVTIILIVDVTNVSSFDMNKVCDAMYIPKLRTDNTTKDQALKISKPKTNYLRH